MNKNKRLKPCPYCYRPWQPGQIKYNSVGMDVDGSYQIDFGWVCPICGRGNNGQLKAYLDKMKCKLICI